MEHFTSAVLPSALQGCENADLVQRLFLFLKIKETDGSLLQLSGLYSTEVLSDACHGAVSPFLNASHVEITTMVSAELVHMQSCGV